MVHLNDRLRELRTSNGSLQKEVASYLGLSVLGYKRYEYGTRKPTSDTIIKLCEYFDVSADYLLGLSDDPTRR